jgi:anti-anti-sigma factor
MKIEFKTIGSKKVIIPFGEVKGVNAIELSEAIERYKKSKFNEIVVDFHNVEYFDSSCLGSLIYSQVMLHKHNKKLALCVPHNHLEKILQDFSFNEAFKIIESYE